MDEKKFRHEIKYYINISDYYTIKNRISKVMKIDENSNSHEGYRIRSLYFDNFRDKALMEKIQGINYREKFRIRFYNNDYSYIKLEKKSKVSGLCNKNSETLTKDQCSELLQGKADFLKHSHRPLFIEFYGKLKGDSLKPKTIVDYTREAYIYPLGNVRITFDKDIKTGIFNTDIFNEELPTIRALDKGIVILEVKYDEFLPELVQHLIQTNNRRSCPMSKYAACRIYG